METVHDALAEHGPRRNEPLDLGQQTRNPVGDGEVAEFHDVNKGIAQVRFSRRLEQ